MPVAAAGELTVMVPVATVQPGWVGVAVGCAGVGGCALTGTVRAGEIQP